MRAVLLLSFPVLILCVAVLIPLLSNWMWGTPLCESWMRTALPYCG